MKIAALYDIHGNLPALNAVLEELKEVQPDLIIVGGDIVPGPMPAQTVERLLQLGDQARFIRGNGDREVVTVYDGQPLNRRYLPAASEKAQEELRWVAGQLTPSQRDFLAALPEQLVWQVEGLGSIVFCHATVRNDEEIFTPVTPEERVSTMFSSVKQDIVVCGHTHMQFERHVGNLRFLNAGSVGMPFVDRPGAYWLLIGPEGYNFRYTMYDKEAAAQEIRASEDPLAQEFIEENVLKAPAEAAMMGILENMAKERWSQEE
jgi:putative phosphoesterase